jgi:hypothetical protein
MDDRTPQAGDPSSDETPSPNADDALAPEVVDGPEVEGDAEPENAGEVDEALVLEGSVEDAPEDESSTEILEIDPETTNAEPDVDPADGTEAVGEAVEGIAPPPADSSDQPVWTPEETENTSVQPEIPREETMEAAASPIDEAELVEAEQAEMAPPTTEAAEDAVQTESASESEQAPSLSDGASPGDSPQGIEGYLEVAIARLREGKPVFGERLFVMGSGPLPSLGGAEGTMGLDERGSIVLLVALPSVDAGVTAPITKELDEIGELNEEELSQLAGTMGEGGIRSAHSEYFSGESPPPDSFNQEQRAILLLEEEPSEATWDALLSQLGPRLAGVYVVEKEAAWTVTPTETETVRREEQLEVATSEPSPVLAPQPKSNLIWLGIVVVGVALAIWGLSRAFLGPDDPTTPSGNVDTVASPVRNVVVGAGLETHTQWIGQHHVLRTSDGRLLALYRSPQGLSIVSDRSNQGREWRRPSTVRSMKLDSFSAAIDEQDNIHIAFHNGSNVSYAVLQQQGVRWTKVGQVRLEEEAVSPVVNISWDEATDVAHVVWAKDASSGQQLYWAAVTSTGPDPTVLDTTALADAGTELTVLATIDVDSNSNVLATYRRPDQVKGWYSRTATPGTDAGTYVWAEEEQVPTEEGIGAVSVALDARGKAHLVLRDSTSFELAYYTKRPGRPWTDSETVVDADSTNEIDFPTISLDTTSKLIYVFFQTDRSEVGSEVHVAINDPASGWEAPVNIAEPTDIPTGAQFPTSISTFSGQPIVLWTAPGGSAPAIQAARISAP